MQKRSTIGRVIAAILAMVTMVTLSGCAANEERSVATKPLITILVHEQESTSQRNSVAQTRKAWQTLADAYSKQKNVRVRVTVTSSSSFASKLRSEMASPVPPTLFMVDGAQGAQRWRDYLADLGRFAAYSHLLNRQLALRRGNTVIGLPATMESFGIAYRADILTRFFALQEEEKKTKSDSADQTESQSDSKNQSNSADQSTSQKDTKGATSTDSRKNTTDQDTADENTQRMAKALSQIDSADKLITLLQDVQSQRSALGINRALAFGGLAEGQTGHHGGWGTNQLADMALACTLGTTNSSSAVHSLDGVDPQQAGKKTGEQAKQQATKPTEQQLRALSCVDGLRDTAHAFARSGGIANQSSAQALNEFENGKAVFLPVQTGVWPTLARRMKISASNATSKTTKNTAKNSVKDSTNAAPNKNTSESSQDALKNAIGFLPIRFASTDSVSSQALTAVEPAVSGTSSAEKPSAGKSTTGKSTDASTQEKVTQRSVAGFMSGSNTYWAINSQASRIDQNATSAFLEWVISSREGAQFEHTLGLWLPYSELAQRRKTLISRAQKALDNPAKTQTKTPDKTPTKTQRTPGTAQSAEQAWSQEDIIKADNPLRDAVTAWWKKASDERHANADLMWKHQLAPTNAWRQKVTLALRNYATTPSDASWQKVQTAFIVEWRNDYLTQEEQ